MKFKQSYAKRSVGDVTALTEAKQDFVRLIAEFERITDISLRYCPVTYIDSFVGF